MTDVKDIVVIGAGIGGLSAAARLAAMGHGVRLLDAAPAPGGKMRSLGSPAGPVDTGPTVLTMRPVFEDLFAACGEALSDHVSLTPLPTLARHVWSDGQTLDLHAHPAASESAIADAFGPCAARDFAAFRARAARLLSAFEGPMIHARAPSQAALTARVLRSPRLIADMAPHRSLAGLLDGAFREPRLRQLFARYATYVGGTAPTAPALLSLIWAAEERGVWAVAGGMTALARAVADLARRHGASVEPDSPVRRIEVADGRVTGVVTDAGAIPADRVVFAGDPAALHRGLLGARVTRAVGARGVSPRSLSALVHAFAARAEGLDLHYHTVLFGDDPDAEPRALAQGRIPEDATLYLCAQDRASGPPAGGPTAPERFEIIRNAPPLSALGRAPTEQELSTWTTRTTQRMAAFGLTLDRRPPPPLDPGALAALYPGSDGAIYGRSPQGLTAGLKRPRAQTRIAGLTLAGGGAHPGAGVPMAALSGKHAAETIGAPRTSTSPSRRAAMLGGT
ncbi:MAG: 1-hydroxycarotenoid 3,4-desaturase CrtD [Paracoccaceae bacterium]